MRGGRGFCAAVAIFCLLSQPCLGAVEEAGKESSPGFSKPQLLITMAELPGGMVGVEYTRILSAEGGVPPYSWVVAGDLPPGLSIDEEGRAIMGTPEVEGSFTFTVRVTDSEGASNSREYSIRVLVDPSVTSELQEPPPSPLVLKTADLSAGKLGREYSASLEAEGGVPPYLWLISGGSLPRGLTLYGDTSEHPSGQSTVVYRTEDGKKSLNKGEAVIRGVPGMHGDYDFSVTVRDRVGETAEADYSVSIGTVRVYITTGYLPDAIIGEEYHYQLDAVGGVTPYWWRIEDGGLPQGLSLDAEEGIISGIPQEASTTWAEGIRTDIEAGLFRVKVMDGIGSRDGAEFRINVVEKEASSSGAEKMPSPTPIILTGGGGLLKRNARQQKNVEEKDDESSEAGGEEETEEAEEEEDKVVVVTDSFTPARINNEYEAALEAAGGSSPYTWSIQGGLPSGLLLDAATGVLGGTPDEADKFTLQVQARDSLGQDSVIKEIIMEVKDALQPVTGLLAAPSDGKAGLAWVNPADEDFEEVKIVRSPSGEPVDSEDGEVAYQGDGDNAVDTGLENGIQYYYAAFALDADGYESGAEEESRASAKPMEVTLTGENDPFADEVVSFNPLTLVPAPFGAAFLPNNVLGPPFYDFSQGDEWQLETYVVSLHARENNDNGATPPYGGSITLRFSDNIVVNDDGLDFTVFSTSFLISIQKKCPECGKWVHIDKEECRHCGFLFKDATGAIEELKKLWMEPAVVEISQDGEEFYRFPLDYVVHYDDYGITDIYNPYSYNCGFAGIWAAKSYAVADTVDPARSGGDQFDLDSITTKKLSWIQYVRLIATGDKWIVDMNGDLVRHPSDFYALSGGAGEGEEAGEARKSGFDLDAITAIHY